MSIEIASLWNSHKGSAPQNNGHSLIPLRFTGNLNRTRERVPVAVAIVHSAYESTEFVWRGRSHSHWEALHSGWWKGFLSHVIKPLRTPACVSQFYTMRLSEKGWLWGHIPSEQMCRFKFQSTRCWVYQ